MPGTINRDAQLSTLANVSYSDTPPLVIGDWHYLSQSAKSNSGFFAVAYINNITKEVVVSYRGTDGLKGDIGADIAFQTGSWNPQFDEAAKFTAEIKSDLRVAPLLGKNGGYTLLTTGHSLGGGIAQLMGKMFDAGGASFDAPGASAVANSTGYAAAQARYAGDSSGQIGASFFNYVSQGSAISSVGTHLGQDQSLVNLADPSAAPLLVGVLGAMTGGAALGLLGLGASANLLDTHLMAGIERAMYIAAGLDRALSDGSLQMSRVPVSQATGSAWNGEGAEPSVVVFKDGKGQIKAYVQRDGDNWIAATPDQSTVINLNKPAGSDVPVCTVQQAGQESYSCTMSQSANSVNISKDANSDGTIDWISTDISSQTINGQIVQVTETKYAQPRQDGVIESKVFETSGGARIENHLRADGHLEEITFGKDPDTGKIVRQSSKVLSYSASERTVASGEVALAGLDLMQALRAGNKLQAAASLVRLVNNAQIAVNQEPVLGEVGTGLSGAVAIVSALDQWGDASDGQRIALAARAVLGANDVVRAISADGKGFLEAGATLGALQGVIALAGLKDVLESGNPFAIASTVMTLSNSAVAMGMFEGVSMFTPQTMIAVAICSVVFGSVFEVEYPDPPPAGTVEIGRLADGTLGLLIKDKADGEVHQTRRLNGQVVSDSAKPTDTMDWGLGAQVLSQRMQSVIGALQAQADATGGHLVLERLPVLSVHAYPSFAGNGETNFFFSLQFNDPVSGAQQLLATAHQDLSQRYAQVAAYAGALVGDTEWAQIGLKRAAGDAFATETEGQFVDRLSGPHEADSLLTQAQADAQAASNRQTYSLLTLDLEGDGQQINLQWGPLSADFHGVTANHPIWLRAA